MAELVRAGVIDTRLSTLLKSGVHACGAIVGLPSPALTEMCGYAGYDFVVIDNEHGPADIETTEHMIRAARLSGAAPIVRTLGHDVIRLLDAGASGIQVPQIESAQEAERIVSACRYHPAGRRAAAFSTRAGGYGFFGGAQHVKRSNEGLVVVLMIESELGMENLDSILRVSGVDVALFGATDLSFSMGFAGDSGNLTVQKAIRSGIKKCLKAGVVPGAIVTTLEEISRYKEMGVRYFGVALTLTIKAAMLVPVAFVKGRSKAAE